jgi:blocked-early-in-transport protein 1
MNYRAPARNSLGSARAQLLGPANSANTMRPTKKDAGANGQSVSEQARLLMEEQSMRDINALAEKVQVMKHLAGDIEAAIQDETPFLAQTAAAFDKATMLMRGTLGNVNKMLTTGGSKHMCYLISFIVGVFLVLYWFMK